MSQEQASIAEKAIRALVQAAHAAQNDVDALMQLHTESVSIINFGGRRLFGRETFREAMVQAMSSDLRDVPTSVTLDRIELLAEGAAVVSCTKTVHDQREPTKRPQLAGTLGMLTYVVVKDAAGWRIASAQTTPVAGSL
jgi:uncharacterized protein (TIGR02246 family)